MNRHTLAGSLLLSYRQLLSMIPALRVAQGLFIFHLPF